MSNIPTKRLARAAYEGYVKQSGGKSLVTGDPLPPFDRLKPEIQEAWAGAVGSLEGEQSIAHRENRQKLLRTIAEASLNARGMRRGVPAITNVLDLVPPQLRKDALDDAELVWDALRMEGIL